MIYHEGVKSEQFINVLLKLALLLCFQFVIVPKLLFGQATAIHVRVVNGRTGHTIPAMSFGFVDYHTDENGQYRDDLNGRKTVTTSVDGDSYIANPDAHGVLVFNGYGYMWTTCSSQKFYDSTTRTYGSDYLYPVSTIISSGLVTKNKCGKATASANAGELVIFIRPTTWWERFVAGMRS